MSVSRSLAGRALALLVPVLLAACGDSGDDEPVEGDAGSTGDTGGEAGASGRAGASGTSGAGGSSSVPAPGDAGPSECNVRATVESVPTSAQHVVQCTPITYSTNPPSGGPHYAIWAAFQSYDFALPAGYLVHSLEHGAVIFWYNCPEGCADEVAEVEAFIASLPEDPLCSGTPAARRAILVPSPELDTRWAASAWGYALSADCFDSAAFGSFYDEHFGRGPEALCNAPAQVFTADPCQ